MTSAVPDLPFPDADRVTSARTDVTVPIDATVDMNLSGRFSGSTAADIAAPTEDVIPGNHPASVPIATPRRPGINPTGSLTRSFCAGVPEPFDASSMTGIPKSPVSRGIITLPPPRIPSWGIGSVMQQYPKAPDIRNAASPQIPLPRVHSP